MFINLSNHPSNLWDKSQLSSASTYGEIEDIPFPMIPPEWDTEQVTEMAEFYFNKINSKLNIIKKVSAVHIAGEAVFCFHLITLLLNEEYTVITSTTQRIVKEEDGKKISLFNFVKFRRYK